jgi:hypothetical protein
MIALVVPSKGKLLGKTIYAINCWFTKNLHKKKEFSLFFNYINSSKVSVSFNAKVKQKKKKKIIFLKKNTCQIKEKKAFHTSDLFLDGAYERKLRFFLLLLPFCFFSVSA